MENCIFCLIAKGDVPSHKVWEDDSHLAFLSIFPNTEGVTVVIPKKHFSSYIFELPDNEAQRLFLAAKKVAAILDKTFDDVARTAMVFEGFGVDHIHAKLFPMHGTSDMKEWKAIESSMNKYFEKYEGYISSHDHKREDDEVLAKLAKRLRSEE